jgi:hypothetical protein
VIDTKGIRRNATLGGDREEFRYLLTRSWEPRQFRLLRFVMLNPSTADAQQDDATIRKCIGFAIALGYTGIAVVNLFAFRARDPKALRAAGYPVGPMNDRFIKISADDAVAEGSDVICAWGVNARGLSRPREVLAILRRAGVAPKALDLCIDGTPAHPLMLSYDLAKRGLLDLKDATA